MILRGGMGAKARKAALARLHPQPGGPPLLAVATGPYIGEGFDCPALDTLFLAAPVGYKGSIVRWAGRILRAHPGKTTAEVHDHHDVRAPVLAASLARRAPATPNSASPTPPGRSCAISRCLTQPVPVCAGARTAVSGPWTASG